MDLSAENSESVDNKDVKDVNFRLKGGILLTAVSGLSAVGAFGVTLASAKRHDPQMFDRGAAITRELPESGVGLALRALKWGTFYAVTGCSLLFYGIWKASGATDLKDFRFKMGSLLPRIPKSEKGRAEFAGLNDLLQYVSSDEYKSETSNKSAHGRL